MTQILSEYHLFGLTAGLFTFLIIGLFHPLVIKGYYYFGLRVRAAFLLLGIATAVIAYMVEDNMWSTNAQFFSRRCLIRPVEVINSANMSS